MLLSARFGNNSHIVLQTTQSPASNTSVTRERELAEIEKLNLVSVDAARYTCQTGLVASTSYAATIQLIVTEVIVIVGRTQKGNNAVSPVEITLQFYKEHQTRNAV